MGRDRPPHPPAQVMGRALSWAYERAPVAADGMLRVGRRYIVPIVRHRLPLRRLTGAAWPGGPPVTLVTAGAAMSLDYLVDRLFTGPPQLEPLGSVSLAMLPGALDRLAAAADLVLACVPSACAGWFGQNYLRVPALVDFRIPVAGDLATTLAAATQTVRRDGRRAAESGYSWATSRAPGDLERFLAEFHRPFVQELFGSRAVLRHPATLRRDFRHGGRILWVRQGGRLVAGALLRVRGHVLHTLIEGVHPTWRREVEPSPSFVVNLAACTLASRGALTDVDLGGAVPSLRDGVCRAKRAWGAMARPWEESHRDLLLRWHEPGSAVQRLLHAAPLLFKAPSGGLCAVVAAPSRDADPWREGMRIWRQLAPRGVRRLFVIGTTGTPPGAAVDCATPDGPVWPCPGAVPVDINRLAASAAPS